MNIKIDRLKNGILRIFFSLFMNRKREIQREEVRKILIFGHMGIGNIIMFIPTIRAFKEYFYNATIFFVLEEEGALELIKQTGLIDQFFILRRGCDIAEKLKLLRKIRKEKFYMVIKPFLGFSHTLIGLSGIPIRVGHATSPEWPIPEDYVYNYKVTMERKQHEIDRGLALFYAISGQKQEVNRNYTFQLPEDAKQYALQLMEKYNMRKDDIIIGMQVGTSNNTEWKQWSPEKVARLADRLIEKYKAKIILLSGPQEVKKGRYVVSKMNYTPVNLIDRTTLLQAGGILSMCSFFICNDSGLMHLSIAVDTPVIAIFGPTDHTRTGPWKDGSTIIREDLRCSPCYKTPSDRFKARNCRHRKCLEIISVDNILNAIKQYLN